jgi:hypothetical protein
MRPIRQRRPFRLLEAEAFDALVGDIRAQGLISPTTLIEAG